MPAVGVSSTPQARSTSSSSESPADGTRPSCGSRAGGESGVVLGLGQVDLDDLQAGAAALVEGQHAVGQPLLDRRAILRDAASAISEQSPTQQLQPARRRPLHPKTAWPPSPTRVTSRLTKRGLRATRASGLERPLQEHPGGR